MEGRDVGRSRPRRAPHWPDRSAHQRRRQARRLFWVAVAALLVLPWFGYRHVREWLGPDPAPPPPVEPVPAAEAIPSGIRDGGADSGTAVLTVEAIGRDARAGDGEAASARLAGLGAQVHRDALLANRGSAVRREAARRGLVAMPGVRSAGWIDRMTVLLLVSSNGTAQAMIGQACRVLATHGDVSGLAVRVQEVAAGAGAAAAMQGDCTPGMAAAAIAPGERHAVPGHSLRIRGSHASALEEDPAAEAERLRREAESLRILRDSTPELQLPPDPRVDP